MSRPEGWAMMPTTGFRTADRRRAVICSRDCRNPEWMEAMTMSRSPRAASGRSSAPAPRQAPAGQRVGEATPRRRLDLPRVLAQFGRDEGEPQRLVDLPLLLPPDSFSVALPEDAVLVDLEPGARSHLPELY